MSKEHPTAFLSESLVLQWSDEWYKAKVKHMTREKYMCMQAAQWSADQELEACCEWISMHTTWDSNRLHTARRPRQQSLKEQVREIIECLVEGNCVTDEDALTLRRTLDFLPWES
jgi:hypothetical protein